MKGFLLLISLLGRGPWTLEDEDNAFFSFLFAAVLGSGLEDGVLTLQDLVFLFLFSDCYLNHLGLLHPSSCSIPNIGLP